MRSVVAAAAISVIASSAHALDKQASAHGGDVDGADTGFNVSGAASFGVSLYNPSYAARPDNSGIALFRYALHADVDLIGRRLSIPIDVNLFTDKLAGGARKLAPSEFDMIVGLTSTWDTGPGAVEFGVRYEVDAPLDQGGYARAAISGPNKQKYIDARARYLYSLAKLWPKLEKSLVGGDISGWLTLGCFALNPTYFARPDNTGRALLRYGFHTELSVLHDHLSFGIDTTFFTDRTAANVVRPTELDLTPEVIVRFEPFEFHLAYERDMPLDQGSYTQEFVYLLGTWAFDLKRKGTAPLEQRGTIPSP